MEKKQKKVGENVRITKIFCKFYTHTRMYTAQREKEREVGDIFYPIIHILLI